MTYHGSLGATTTTVDAHDFKTVNVRDLQCRLNAGLRLGQRLAVDGTWGPQTRAKIEQIPVVMPVHPGFTDGRREARYQNTTAGASTVRINELIKNWLWRYPCAPATTAPAAPPATTVPEPTSETPLIDESAEGGGTNWTPWLIGGAVVFGGAGLYFMYRRRKAGAPVTANRRRRRRRRRSN